MHFFFKNWFKDVDCQAVVLKLSVLQSWSERAEQSGVE